MPVFAAIAYRQLSRKEEAHAGCKVAFLKHALSVQAKEAISKDNMSIESEMELVRQELQETNVVLEQVCCTVHSVDVS